MTGSVQALLDQRHNLVNVLGGVEHAEGDANTASLGRHANLVLREIVVPLGNRQIHHVDVRTAGTSARSNEAHVELFELGDQPITEREHMLFDSLDAGLLNETDRARQGMQIRKVVVAELEATRILARCKIVRPRYVVFGGFARLLIARYAG